MGMNFHGFYHLHRENRYNWRNDWLKEKCVVTNGLGWYLTLFCFILVYMAEDGGFLKPGDHSLFNT